MKHILYVSDINHSSGLRGTAIFNCPFTQDCENDSCFWKQRDCFKRPPFVFLPMEEYLKRHQEVDDLVGEPYFPEWKVFAGTNCLMMYCQDTKVDGKFPNKPEPPSQSGV